MSYRDRRVLDGVDLDLFAGRTVALLGPNGAGKTSLMRLVAVRLAPPAIQPAGIGSEVVLHPPVLPAPAEIRAAGDAPGLGSGFAAPTAASGPGFWSCRVSNRGGMHPGFHAPIPTCLVVTTWFDREFRVSS